MIKPKDYEGKLITKEVMLRREYFKNNADGETEFNWVLHQLGIPASEYENIEEITLGVDQIKELITVEDEA